VGPIFGRTIEYHPPTSGQPSYSSSDGSAGTVNLFARPSHLGFDFFFLLTGFLSAVTIEPPGTTCPRAFQRMDLDLVGRNLRFALWAPNITCCLI
jgi:hypothetical protein